MRSYPVTHARTFNNRKVEAGGYVFDSRLEARRWQQLRLMEQAGAIRNLQVKPSFMLQPGYRDADGKAQRAVTWTPDFTYQDGDGGWVAEDVKGGPVTEVTRLKLKLFSYQYKDYRVRLVRAADVGR